LSTLCNKEKKTKGAVSLSVKNTQLLKQTSNKKVQIHNPSQMSLLLDSFSFFPRIFFEEFYSTTPQFWTPKADIKTTEKELIITLELPGVHKDQLNVEVYVSDWIYFLFQMTSSLELFIFKKTKVKYNRK
jgi:hypothetical protein